VVNSFDYSHGRGRQMQTERKDLDALARDGTNPRDPEERRTKEHHYWGVRVSVLKARLYQGALVSPLMIESRSPSQDEPLHVAGKNRGK
jgi:hypothetical protein